MKLLSRVILPLTLLYTGLSHGADPVKILFFSKSSGFEHSVISWKKGKPSHAEKALDGLAKQHNWTFEHSKDGSKFNADYLKQFDTIIFYTTGDLTQPGRDK